MSTGEIIALIGAPFSVIAVLLAIMGMGMFNIQRTDAMEARLDAKIDAKIEGAEARLDAKIEGVKDSLSSRISDVEREQARQSGINSVLVQLASSRGGDSDAA